VTLETFSGSRWLLWSSVSIFGPRLGTFRYRNFPFKISWIDVFEMSGIDNASSLTFDRRSRGMTWGLSPQSHKNWRVSTFFFVVRFRVTSQNFSTPFSDVFNVLTRHFALKNRITEFTHGGLRDHWARLKCVLDQLTSKTLWSDAFFVDGKTQSRDSSGNFVEKRFLWTLAHSNDITCIICLWISFRENSRKFSSNIRFEITFRPNRDCDNTAETRDCRNSRSIDGISCSYVPGRRFEL